MAWRFRKSFTPIPGVRLTLSPSGISTSVGVGPARLTLGSRGASVSASIPGTGLSFHQPLTPGRPLPSRPAAADAPMPFAPTALPGAGPAPLYDSTPSGQGMQAISSAGSAALTTAGLAAFKASLMESEKQHSSIASDLERATQAENEHGRLCHRWQTGWIMRRVFKKKFARIVSQAEESLALKKELEEQLALSTLKTDFEMPDGVAKAYARLCDDFVECTRSQRIWDNVAQRATNRAAERTTASRIVDLKPVKFSVGKCGVIDTATPVPRMENANGGDIFFYPGFLVYHASQTNYALIEYQELDLQVVRTQFQEESAVPTDAEQVGTTWAKANKDGSPDRRFANNYQIPVMRYARLTLNTSTGLNEEYMLSNVAATEQLAASWNALLEAVRLGR